MFESIHVCDLCSSEAPRAAEDDALGMPVLPEGWAQVRVNMSEKVLPKMATDFIEAMPPSAMAVLPPGMMQVGLAQMGGPFHTHFHICPDCQEGMLWQAVWARLDAARGNAGAEAGAEE